MATTDTIPIVMTTSGYLPQTPTALNNQLIANVAVTSPGYTANLPGTLIEDVSSTDVYALLQLDSSLAELIGSITPYGANLYLLNQFAQVYGIQPQPQYNTSVYVVISGPPGFPINPGFLVSDGTYQYVINDGALIDEGGQTPQILAVATTIGSWAIPQGSVNQIATSIPSDLSPTLTVLNPQAGIPASSSETSTQWRARTLQAGLAICQGEQRFAKTLIQNVPGVQARLVSFWLNPLNNLWEIIVGGGDPYQVAYAIFTGVGDLLNVSGSVMAVSGITNASPGVVSTSLNHGYTSGQVVTINGATIIGGGPMVGVDGIPTNINVIDEKTFSIGIDTTSLGTYTGGGVLTPNFRNITVSILDYPDTYNVTFVNPPQQVVTMTVTWNTTATNYINPASISSLAIPAIVDQINAIPVGQPINIFQLQSAFLSAVADVIPPQLLTRLIFTISVNGISSVPVSGTGEIPGDPESYFYTNSSLVTVTQG